MSFKSWQPDLKVGVAPEIVIYLILLHGVASMGLYLSSLDGWLLLLVSVVIVGSFVVGIWNYVYSAERITRLLWVEREGKPGQINGCWQLWSESGRVFEASLHSGSVMTSFFLFLVFVSNGKKKALILTPHNVEKDQWRRLMVGLRFGQF